MDGSGVRDAVQAKQFGPALWVKPLARKECIETYGIASKARTGVIDPVLVTE